MSVGQKPNATGQMRGKVKIVRFTTRLVLAIPLSAISLAAKKVHSSFPADLKCPNGHSARTPHPESAEQVNQEKVSRDGATHRTVNFYHLLLDSIFEEGCDAFNYRHTVA
jgi:hypothetical protein